MSNTLHVDDFAVWCAEEHTTTAVHRIQNTIQLNTTKTVSTLFTLSTAKEKVSLKLNNQPVPQVETPTFLGVTLDACLKWKPHLEAVEAKAIRKLAIMKKTCRNHLWGQLRHPERGLHRGCKTSRRVCLHNLGYCLKKKKKKKKKQARQSVEHGPDNYLRCYVKHTNPTNGKDCRPSTFGVQT